MRQWHIWLIAGVVSVTTTLLCSIIGLGVALLFRHEIAAALVPIATPAAASRSTEPIDSSSAPASPSPDPSAELSSRRETTPTAISTSDAALYEDDFSDPDSGWYEEDDVDGLGSIGYANDRYRVRVTEADAYLWGMQRSLKLSRLGDVRIEVDAEQIAGDDISSFGLVCRVRGDRFYTFEISSDGWYGIGKADGDSFALLAEAGDTMSVSHVTTESYKLRADCVGNTLALYVNGRKLVEARDSDFAKGSIGVIVSNYDAPLTEVHFDNVVVHAP